MIKVIKYIYSFNKSNSIITYASSISFYSFISLLSVYYTLKTVTYYNYLSIISSISFFISISSIVYSFIKIRNIIYEKKKIKTDNYIKNRIKSFLYSFIIIIIIGLYLVFLVIQNKLITMILDNIKFIDKTYIYFLFDNLFEIIMLFLAINLAYNVLFDKRLLTKWKEALIVSGLIYVLVKLTSISYTIIEYYSLKDTYLISISLLFVFSLNYIICFSFFYVGA